MSSGTGPAGSPNRLVCLDTGVWIAYLIPEDLQSAARAVVREALDDEAVLVAPSFAWAEIGSVLRKKVRSALLEEAGAYSLFRDFQALPIETIDTAVVRFRAWEIARKFSLPTLYDAAFLACTELASPPGAPIADRTFWTADRTLVGNLGSERPPYVRLLV